MSRTVPPLKWSRLLAACSASLLLCATPLWADKKAKSKSMTPLEAFLERARTVEAAISASVGSLWLPSSSFTNLNIDFKARRALDPIVIRIVEERQSSAQGSVQAGRDFSADSGISGFFGSPGAASGLQKLFTANSTHSLDGSAQTASNMSLLTTVSGHVAEVLPNGLLVIEAYRTVEMDNQKHQIILRGVLRPGDIAPDNSVLSTQISLLELEVVGKGVITDSVRRPNFAVRWLLRILGF